MTALDWLVLLSTTLGIVLYGLWVTRRQESTLHEYVRGGGALGWPTIGLSVMATQASAITFLSVPGQAYEDGLRFVQFYFGMPLAVVVVALVFVPLYYKAGVYTAYEYLERRFDVRVRAFGAVIFLISRGLAAGITLYAPAILLSAVLHLPLTAMVVAMGVLTLVYTVVGGARAIGATQKHQMAVILLGLVAAGWVAFRALPAEVSAGDALTLAGAAGRLHAVDWSFDLTQRYNVWSGVLGGFFLSLAYFGTDQSQVGRYLTGSSPRESQLGLMFNGILKIPMQLAILFLGAVVYVVYLFASPPAFWNTPAYQAAQRGDPAAFVALEGRWDEAVGARRDSAYAVLSGAPPETLVAAQRELDTVRAEVKAAVVRAAPGTEPKDSDYIFLRFALDFLPSGLLGLLVAVILAAAMSSIAGELSALGSTTALDLHHRLRPASPERVVWLTRAYTVLWGLLAISFASTASLLDNLIQAVNILGSLFYGTMLGLFVTALFLPRVGASAALAGGAAAQLSVLVLYATTDIGFLWFNAIGCALVCGVASVVQLTRRPA